MVGKGVAITAAAVTALVVACAAAGMTLTAQPSEGHQSFVIVEGQGEPTPLTDGELEDLATFARQNGITVDEAISRFHGQTQFGDLAAAAQAAYPHSFAAARWEPGDGYQGVIEFAGPIPVDIVADIARSAVTVKLVSTDGVAESSAVIAQLAVHETLYAAAGVENVVSTVDPAGRTLYVEVQPSAGVVVSIPELEAIALEAVRETLGVRAAEALDMVIAIELVDGLVVVP